MSKHVRKIPAILVDRAPIRWGRVVLFSLLGLLFGAVLGALLGWLSAAGVELDSGLALSTGLLDWPFLVPGALLGLAVGLVHGLFSGRAPEPRVGLVEVESRSWAFRSRVAEVFENRLETHGD